jgi:CHAT domain-containing protein
MDDLDLADEISAVRSLQSPEITVEILEHPRACEAMQSITECSVVHFACHASSDNDRPSMSALYLGKEEVDILTVRTLQPLSHQIAQVAYLSACSTTEISARNLIDESIHLASTLQLIGFRHVIGTLWSADDESAVEIAAAFYKGLIEGVGDEHIVADALHYALLVWRCELRKRENVRRSGT